MQHLVNPFVTMYQTQLEVSRRCADAVFSGTERIDRMLILATRRAISDQLQLAQALAQTREPREAGTALQSTLLGRGSEEMSNYQKELMQIFVDMQSDIGRSLQDGMQQLNSLQQAGTERASDNGRQQAGAAGFNPVTDMFSAWESAFKEAAALASRNMTAARSAFDEAALRTRQASSAVMQGNGVSAAARAAGHAADGDKRGKRR